jgi:hypothetical protein
VSASDDRTLRLWDLTTGACVRTLEGHSGPVRAVALTGDGRHAMSGSLDGTVQLWDLATDASLRTIEEHTDAVVSVALSTEGRHAASGGTDATARLWFLDWALAVPEVAAPDDDPEPYLEAFLRAHLPRPVGRRRRRLPPTWTERDLQDLLGALVAAGHDDIEPDEVRRRLRELTERQRNE